MVLDVFSIQVIGIVSLTWQPHLIFITMWLWKHYYGFKLFPILYDCWCSKITLEEEHCWELPFLTLRMANFYMGNRNQIASFLDSPERSEVPRSLAGTVRVVESRLWRVCVNSVPVLLVAGEFLLHLVSTQNKLCCWLFQEDRLLISSFREFLIVLPLVLFSALKFCVLLNR